LVASFDLINRDLALFKIVKTPGSIFLLSLLFSIEPSRLLQWLEQLVYDVQEIKAFQLCVRFRACPIAQGINNQVKTIQKRMYPRVVAVWTSHRSLQSDHSYSIQHSQKFFLILRKFLLIKWQNSFFLSQDFLIGTRFLFLAEDFFSCSKKNVLVARKKSCGKNKTIVTSSRGIFLASEKNMRVNCAISQYISAGKSFLGVPKVLEAREENMEDDSFENYKFRYARHFAPRRVPRWEVRRATRKRAVTGYFYFRMLRFWIICDGLVSQESEFGVGVVCRGRRICGRGVRHSAGHAARHTAGRAAGRAARNAAGISPLDQDGQRGASPYREDVRGNVCHGWVSGPTKEQTKTLFVIEGFPNGERQAPGKDATTYGCFIGLAGHTHKQVVHQMTKLCFKIWKARKTMTFD